MANQFHNFLIVGTQRTGSSALAELVNTHPNIACGWEWTEHTSPTKKLAALERGLAGNFNDLDEKNREHIESSLTEETRWLGFRRLFGASNKWLVNPGLSLKLVADRFAAHKKWLASHPEVRLVHIVRNNDVAWLKSKFVARSLSSFVGSSYPDGTQVNIPIREAKARVAAKHWLDRALKDLATTNPYLRIDYETMAKDIASEAERIVTFLDCDPTQLNLDGTQIKKQSTRHDKDYIANYEELLAALQTTDLPEQTL